MASTEPTSVARTSETSGSRVDADEETVSASASGSADDVSVTTELPPTGSQGRRRRRDRGDKTSSDDWTTDEESPAHAPLFAPARRPGRRVVRIVRHIQLWSVFKIALLGGLVLYGVFLLAVIVGWSLANTTGQVHHIEKFMRDIGFDNWSFNGPQLLRGAALGGAILLAATSIFITLWAAVVNLISELTGGLRFTVIETDETDDDADEDDEDENGG